MSTLGVDSMREGSQSTSMTKWPLFQPLPCKKHHGTVRSFAVQCKRNHPNGSKNSKIRSLCFRFLFLNEALGNGHDQEVNYDQQGRHGDGKKCDPGIEMKPQKSGQ